MLIRETAHVDNVLEVVIDDKISKEDMEELKWKIEKVKEKSDEVNLLVDVRDIKGYTPKAMTEDIKIMGKHTKDINKIAMFTVTDQKWVELGGKLSGIVPGIQTKEFEHGQREEAIEWLRH